MNNKTKLLLVIVGVLGATSQSFAAFDPAATITSLEGAATSAGTIVAALVALGAGLMIYKKVKGYFSKAS